MFHPFLAHKMNRLFRNETAEQLPAELVDYADIVIRGLHVALQEQTKPVYHRPEHPIDGWGLTVTPLETRGRLANVPTESLVGSRAIYLSARPNVMLRMLTAPHPRDPFEEQVIQIRSTSVPKLLREDPSLYYGLLDAAEESIVEYGLNYTISEPPLPSSSL